ncbi:hypothetical protein CKO51_09620 [Rhodopirellula sp. SM50]|nr:hypothetical protein CKO51_09620 [Rhodopirellula sp. SM50]
MQTWVTGKGGDHQLLRCITLFLSLVVASGAVASKVHAEVDAAAVNRAIDRGVTYLRSAQNDRGGWDEFQGQSCGLSSLCTLALLNAGVSRDDPAIKNAMSYLRATVAESTYSVALQTLVFCQHGSASDLPRIRNNVTWLTEAQTATGAWSYGGKRQFGGDPSNAQFALLALGAAQDRGVTVKPEVFEQAIDYWELQQNPNGGWSYSGGAPTGSMTCAGIASLIIANGRLGNASSSVKDGRIECCGGDSTKQDPIARGIDWLGKRFSADVNPGGSADTYYYYLYAIERTGRLSGRRFFGGHDWYREGAERLIRQQDGFQGFWEGGQWERPTVATSFALLFLSKGKRQVVVGQLERDKTDQREWQPHPDALRQLVRHVERAWGRDLTWQTVQLENAGLIDLLQTPVLVISGKETLALSAENSELLKDYVDQGGTIVFDASGDSGCGNAANFQNSVANLCAQWYPNAPLERLPTSHPVWNAERNVDITAMPNGFWVYGVQACCRTAVFYVPQSLTCRWELGDRLFQRGETDDPVRRQIDHSIRIGQNIIAYATGRELKDKLDAQIVLQADAMELTERGTTRIARLDVGAGGEDARRALPNASTIIRNQTQVAISVPEDPVRFDEQDLAEVSVLWVHGRRDFVLTAEQREALRQFIEHGGVILGTAICGDEAFAQAFRRELAAVLGQNSLQSMPSDHPMLTPQYFGYDLRSVTIRRIGRGAGGQQIRRQTSPPILEYAEVDEVVAVVFSPLDISCALESQNSVQCPGYGTEDAAKIVTNVVQMALNQ